MSAAEATASQAPGSAGTVVMVGSGNVATHLARAAAAAGLRIRQVVSRNPEHGRRLASEFDGCEAVTDPSQAVADADYYIVAASDAATQTLAKALPRTTGLVVHTSGSVPMADIAGPSDSYGVLYPLQTFSREAEVDVSEVPFFIEGSTPEAQRAVEALARRLSRRVYPADSDTRRYLHVAGVLSNNFVNLLLTMTHDVLRQKGLPLDVVRPLLEVTVDKAMKMADPRLAQTGPAVRGDTATVERHKALLPPEDAALYDTLSQAIVNRQ